MAHDGQDLSLGSVILPDLLSLTGAAVAPVEEVFEIARSRVREMVTGQPDRGAWACLAGHLCRIAAPDAGLGRTDAGRGHLWRGGAADLHQIAFGEYLWQVYGGIQMNQGEMVRLQDMGLTQDDMRAMMSDAVMTLTQNANTQAARTRLVELMQERSAEITVGRRARRRTGNDPRTVPPLFADDKVVPYAHEWHLKDELIPMEVIEELAEMGVFGLTIPEEFGGFGLSKISMCVVSEELSRGYIGVGSLGTRSEIAAELIIAAAPTSRRKSGCPDRLR
jgi:(2S)-methylsuccinyl-CoA dehydrogenase